MLVLVVVIVVVHLQSGQKQLDKPKKGDMVFKMDKVWEIEDAGEAPFASIRDLMVLEDGTAYIYDSKNLRIYIVSKEGKAVRAFGRMGEGPGEIRQLRQAKLRRAGDKIVVQEDRRIHYFKRNGDFIRSQTVLEAQNPILFLNENETITAPIHLRQIRNKRGIGKIRRINLKTGAQSVIASFSMFKGGMSVSKSGGRATVTDTSLTPMMIITHFNGRLYYGMNDEYWITVSDLTGKRLNSFGIERKRRWISDKVKEDELIASAKDRAPVELLKRLAKTMANEMNHFSNIEIHKGLLYVFTPYYVRNHRQQIDIFSTGGTFLYRAFIELDPELKMTREPLIRNGFVYISMENDEGDITVAKYSIALPKA